MIKKLAEAMVSIGAIEKGLGLAIGSNSPVLTDPQKDDPVDGELNGKIKFPH